MRAPKPCFAPRSNDIPNFQSAFSVANQTMIDWASLVADSAPQTHGNAPFNGLYPQKVGTDLGGVGTDSITQAIGKEHVFQSVPTVPTVPTTFERPRVEECENSNPMAFYVPAGGGIEGQSAPHRKPVEPACRTCVRFRRPGLSDGYCSERADLPPAYTHEHPLRKPPDDGGVSCTAWLQHPNM